MTPELRKLEDNILAHGHVGGRELEHLRGHLYAGSRIERPAADFLVGLHRRVQHRTPAFERFFYRAVKDHVLAAGLIDAGAAAWLRQMVFAEGAIDDDERRLLHELRGAATPQRSPEFEALFQHRMSQPQEQQVPG